jgi:hypothetical protein
MCQFSSAVLSCTNTNCLTLTVQQRCTLEFYTAPLQLNSIPAILVAPNSSSNSIRSQHLLHLRFTQGAATATTAVSGATAMWSEPVCIDGMHTSNSSNDSTNDGNSDSISEYSVRLAYQRDSIGEQET